MSGAVSVHILHTPMTEVRRQSIGERWCFHCRKRRDFEQVRDVPVLNPDVPLEDQTGAYYGPSDHIECAFCKTWDSDCFPGRERCWYD